MQQQRNLTTVSQMMTKTRDLQNKVNSLSRSSSGATHVPDQTSAIVRSRTLPRCDCGLPRNTQNCTGIMGNVFERPPVQEGLSSTVFHNLKNLASSSQVSKPDISETARREMKWESLNAPTQSPHFLSRSGMSGHTGWIYSHSGMMDYPKVPVTEWNFGKFSWPYGISKLEDQRQNWSLYADSWSSGHNALDHRSWDCFVNWRTCHIAIDDRAA